MSYENPWTYNNQPFDVSDIQGHVGFVYQITDPQGRKYIGKKILVNRVRKPPLKGKTKGRISYKQSDWQTYYGSNEELAALVASGNPLDFKREILRLCNSKSEMGYYESKLIFETDAILRDEYYNSWVSARINRNQLVKCLLTTK